MIKVDQSVVHIFIYFLLIQSSVVIVFSMVWVHSMINDKLDCT